MALKSKSSSNIYIQNLYKQLIEKAPFAENQYYKELIKHLQIQQCEQGDKK